MSKVIGVYSCRRAHKLASCAGVICSVSGVVTCNIQPSKKEQRLRHPRNAGIFILKSHRSFRSVLCLCGACSKLTGFVFMKVYGVIHSSLSKADDCWN